jgi:hypothetical protein
MPVTQRPAPLREIRRVSCGQTEREQRNRNFSEPGAGHDFHGCAPWLAVMMLKFNRDVSGSEGSVTGLERRAHLDPAREMNPPKNWNAGFIRQHAAITRGCRLKSAFRGQCQGAPIHTPQS